MMKFRNSPSRKQLHGQTSTKPIKGIILFFQDYIYFTEDKQGIIQFLLQMVAYSLNLKNFSFV